MSFCKITPILFKVVVTVFVSFLTGPALLGQSEEICPALYDSFALKAGSALVFDRSRLNKPECKVDGNGNTTCELLCFYGPRNGPGTSFTFDIRWTTQFIGQNAAAHGICASPPASRSLPHTTRQAVIFFGGDSRPAAADRLAGEILAKIAPKAAPCPGARSGSQKCEDIAKRAMTEAMALRTIDVELSHLGNSEKKLLDTRSNLARLNEVIKALENRANVGPGVELANKFKTDNVWRRRIARSYLFLWDEDPYALALALRAHLNDKVKYYSSADKRIKDLVGEQIAAVLRVRSARSELAVQRCQDEAELQSCDIDGDWILEGSPLSSNRYIEIGSWNFTPSADDVFAATRKDDGWAANLSLFGRFGVLPIKDDDMEGQIGLVFSRSCDEAAGFRTLWGDSRRYSVRLTRKRS